MKRFTVLLISLLLIGSGFFSASAQEKSKEDQQKEEELLRAIGEQKKALNQQREEQKRASQELEKSIQELEKLKDMDFDFDFNVDEDGQNVRIYKRGRSFMPQDLGIPYTVPEVPGVPMIHFYGGGISEGTSWDFSRSVKEASFKKEYDFEVEKTAKSVTIGVNGDCRDGEIRIKILTPNGKTYSDVVIDEFGNLNVRKSFSISEDENQDKVGEWKFIVDSEKASGYFRISFQTH